MKCCSFFCEYTGMLYRTGLPSNAATPLALFVRVGPLCFCMYTRRQTYVAVNTTTAAQIMR